MKFVKMHGIGNDYVFVDCFKEAIKESIKDPATLARKVSDRHFGIGSDGLILIEPSKSADAMMRIFNADGSEAQMCGNGVRCVAKYIYDYGITNDKKVRIETLAGIKELELMVENGMVKEVKVNMGKPELKRAQIPMVGDENTEVIDEVLKVESGKSDESCKFRKFKITCVSMGNPHCVIFVDNLCNVPLTEYGPLIENHDLFPERINVHFVQIIESNRVDMKTWERGSGVTLACGTGASAVCVAGVLNKKTDSKILARLPGGNLELEWAKDENVYMTGSATESFKGEWELPNAL